MYIKQYAVPTTLFIYKTIGIIHLIASPSLGFLIVLVLCGHSLFVWIEHGVYTVCIPRIGSSTYLRIKIFLRVLAVWAKTVYANKNDNSKTHNRYRYIYREVFWFKNC